jgi:hypothetical protein
MIRLSPLRLEPSCWKTKKKQGMKPSPSGIKNSDGSIKQVNNCVPK